MTSSDFHHLGLIEQITRSLDANGYKTPTPIQRSAIPVLLEGRDLLGIAQTGTGKTAAFSLPMLQKLFQTQENPVPKTTRALVLAPTRELAIQIADNCKIYGANLSLRQTCIFGGVSQVPQVKAMQKGVDLLIATPGRLLDLMNQREIDLRRVSFFVLDEADRMLDMGFIHDIRKIVAVLPKKRQTMLFSATMPPPIALLAQSVLHEPQRIEVTPKVVTVERIEQGVYLTTKGDKRALLATLLQDPSYDRTIVFSKTKHGANRIVTELHHIGVTCAAIHGNKSQNARQKALEEFKTGEIRVLVATDIAARGIDVDNISHVVNYDLPDEPESYVHRIGRTARAGTQGIAVSFCDETERRLLQDIQRLIKKTLPVLPVPPLLKLEAAPKTERGPRPQPRGKANPPRNKSGERKPEARNEPSAQTKPAGQNRRRRRR